MFHCHGTNVTASYTFATGNPATWTWPERFVRKTTCEQHNILISLLFFAIATSHRPACYKVYKVIWSALLSNTLNCRYYCKTGTKIINTCVGRKVWRIYAQTVCIRLAKKALFSGSSWSIGYVSFLLVDLQIKNTHKFISFWINYHARELKRTELNTIFLSL